MELARAGTPPAQVCREAGCSRSWLFKWLKRAEAGGECWAASLSRAPKSVPSRLPAEAEEAVARARTALEAKPYRQVGPQAVAYEMAASGDDPPPPWTIARVLRRRGLARPQRKAPYRPKGTAYPEGYCSCHQADLVGPRHLAARGRFYFFNIVDCETHWAGSAILRDRRADGVCAALAAFWREFGRPDSRQMDNDLAFWGSLKDPRVVGKVIRLCIENEVAPVFIPLKEPWRNGVVEHFNRKAQWILDERHEDFASLAKAKDAFLRVHNHAHRYSAQGNLTPAEAAAEGGFRLKGCKMPDMKAHLENGVIHVVRLIRSDGAFRLHGMKWRMPEEAVHEYVTATIVVRCREIRFDLGGRHLFTDEFLVRQESTMSCEKKHARHRERPMGAFQSTMLC